MRKTTVDAGDWDPTQNYENYFNGSSDYFE